MFNSTLIQLVKTLNRKEMTRFKEFAHSPYFNKHTQVRALCDYLSEIYPYFTERNCSKDAFFKKNILKENAINQRELHLLFNYTINLLEHFLSQEQFKKQQQTQQLYLLQQWREKAQFKRYEKTLKKAETQITHSPLRNSIFYNHCFQLAIEKDNYYTQQNKNQKDQSLQSKQHNLDLFYLSEKLRDACEMMSRSRIMQVGENLGMIEAVIDEVQKHTEKYRSIPSVIIYYHIYRMFTTENHAYFYELIPLLEQHNQHFPISEQKHLYTFAQNYCITQINKGEASFLENLFELYQAQLQQNLFIDEGYLSQWHYKNITTVALRLKEFEWTKHFIETYKTQLHPDIVSNAYAFNLATYYYSILDFEKVLDLLIQVEYTDLRYSLDAKSLLLRTYYDIEEDEAFYALADAFKIYLKRNKLISDFRRQGYHYLLQLAQQAFRIKTNTAYWTKAQKQKKLQKLQEAMQLKQPIFNLEWLSAKVKEL